MIARATEQIGKVAHGVVEALKNQPLLLSLVVLNIAMILFMFYYITNTFRARTANLEQIYKGQDKIFEQWSDLLKNQQTLAERLEHCVTVDDVKKILEIGKQPHNTDKNADLGG